MPWSFVSHIEQIMKVCRRAGFEQEIPIGKLRVEMMRVTGVTNKGKLGHYLHVMEELGYIRRKGDLVAEFCLSYALPYEFKAEEKPEVEKPELPRELEKEISDIKAAEVLKPGTKGKK